MWMHSQSAAGDQDSSAARAEHLSRCADRMDAASNVDGDVAVEVAIAHVQQVPFSHDGGVVENDRESPGDTIRRSYGRAHRVGVGRVVRDSVGVDSFANQLRNKRGEVFGISAGKNDGPAFSAEAFRDGP